MFRTAIKVYLVLIAFGLLAQTVDAGSYAPPPAKPSSSSSSPTPTAPAARPAFTPAPGRSAPSAPAFTPDPKKATAPAASKPAFTPDPKKAAQPTVQPAPVAQPTVIERHTTVVYDRRPSGGGFWSTVGGTFAGMWLFQSCNNRNNG